jgi:peptide-methionine (S)-S-oxide reductase
VNRKARTIAVADCGLVEWMKSPGIFITGLFQQKLNTKCCCSIEWRTCETPSGSWANALFPEVFAMIRVVLSFLFLVAAPSLLLPQAVAREAKVVPAAVLDEKPAQDASSEVAILAGGCFWGVQGVFQHVEGVANAVSGYAGGAAETAQYHVVGTGETGHAEAVRVTFDPRKISYGRILQIYFSVAHNPTQLNYQGPDKGTQYRSTVFPMSAGQETVAKAYIAQLNDAKVFAKPVVTTVEPGRTFYPAEDYHQDYMTLHPDSLYIMYNDLPKIDDLKALFPEAYRDDPVLVSEAKLEN